MPNTALNTVGVKELTPDEALVAQLLAEGIPQAEAAKQVGFGPEKMKYLVRKREFQERVTLIRQTIAEQFLATFVSLKEFRLKELQAEWDRTEEVRLARAADPDYQNQPGGHTGLLTKTLKAGPGRGQIIEEYQVDIPLIKERRAIFQQAAQEMGQWKTPEISSGEKNVNFTIKIDSRAEIHREVEDAEFTVIPLPSVSDG